MTKYPKDRPIQIEFGVGRLGLDPNAAGRKVGTLIGIDINDLEETKPEIVLQVGFEALPFSDNYADKIIASHFMEHLPKVCYIPTSYMNKRLQCDFKFLIHRPIIYTFEEVYRVLKPNGIFEIISPSFPEHWSWDHPNHLSEWGEGTANHFTKQDKLHDYRFNFELIKEELKENTFYATFKKKKDSFDNFPTIKNIYRPIPVNPEDYYVLTLEHVEELCKICNWEFVNGQYKIKK